MLIKNFLPFLCISLVITGCAHGPGVKPDLPDSLTVQINNDATGTMLMRGGHLHTYASARCEGEEKQAGKLSMDSQETLSTVPVTPGKPFTFALSTLNAQSFKGNWGCSVTATFTPVAGTRYHAILQTENDNATCKITVMDQQDQVVPATSPDYSCPKTLSGTARNGQRWSSVPKIYL